jgi:hypothetical protein
MSIVSGIIYLILWKAPYRAQTQNLGSEVTSLVVLDLKGIK